MNRASSPSLRSVTGAIVLLCVMALTLCQLLGPTARLNHDFTPIDLAEQTYVLATAHNSGPHIPLPTRCAAIKLAPVDVMRADFTPSAVTCEVLSVHVSTPPPSIELGVPTPPPRAA